MRNAYLYLHLSVLLAGFTGIFGKLIQLNEGLLVWYRIALSTMMLGAILIFNRSRLKYPIREVLSLIVPGIVLTIHWLFFFGSIKHSNVAVGTICFGLTGFFTAILQPLIRKRKINMNEILLSIITLAGIAMIFHFDTQFRVGIILGVTSSVFSALYTILNEGLVKKYDAKLLNFYQLGAGTIFLGLIMPIYLKFNPTDYLFPNSLDSLYIFILAFFCTVILYVLFNASLKILSAFTVNLSFNLEPIYSIALAFIIFKEHQQLNNYFFMGISLVMLSVILQSLLAFKKYKTATNLKVQ
jgi:drug/metabolite transporter (DMT)-like permease